MSSNSKICAILLPLSSKNYNSLESLKNGLTEFYQSCLINFSSQGVKPIIYVGIDLGDKLLDGIDFDIKSFFETHGSPCVKVEKFEPAKPARICSIWRELSRIAYREDQADYYVLLGDDVTVFSKNDSKFWFDHIQKEFSSFQMKYPKLPYGFGCISLNDTKAPSFPTFPIVHRVHMDIFQGEIFPNQFINQDADPFLFQLYKKWGMSKITDLVDITNEIGGYQNGNDPTYIMPRYEREHIDWKGSSLLLNSVNTIQTWLEQNNIDIPERILIDIVVPSYRVNPEFLKCILNISIPEDRAVTMFIIVIDNPTADLTWLKNYQLSLPPGRLLIRQHDKNLGASEARNSGVKESNADWILFIDDDVIPPKDLLIHYLDSIDEHGKERDGFAGPTILPLNNKIFSNAVRLSGVNFFWIAPSKMKEIPWGITANLVIRNYHPKLLFDPKFIKTGGGEDIDYCLRIPKSKWPLKCVPKAVVDHPWWDNGDRCYRHFFNWALGDSYLINKYPNFTYLSFPNVVEFSIGISFLYYIPSFIILNQSYSIMMIRWFSIITLIWFFDILCDFIEISFYDQDKKEILSRISGNFSKIMMVVESNLIKNFSELGHFLGPLSRGEIRICKRFDWFCGQLAPFQGKEVVKAFWRFFLFCLILYSINKIDILRLFK